MTLDRFRPLVIRAVLLTAAVAGLVALARSDALHGAVLDLLEASRAVIAAHPVAGPLVFIGLSALSAMAGFVSSAVIVPAAVYAWGATLTALLLWIGWLLGGLVAYTIAATVGRPALRWLVPAGALGRYQEFLARRPKFTSVLLLQLALPSEIPGYLLGLARYPLKLYLAALAIAELPYAIGTVLLGLSFVERRIGMLIALAGAGLLGAALLVRALRRNRAADAARPTES